MNGSLKHDTKATDGGGLALTLCTGVLGKVEGEDLPQEMDLVVSSAKMY